jgi:hypothetical protein
MQRSRRRKLARLAGRPEMQAHVTARVQAPGVETDMDRLKRRSKSKKDNTWSSEDFSRQVLGRYFDLGKKPVAPTEDTLTIEVGGDDK